MLTDNIAAYYKFDENTGSTVADATGNGNTGTWGGTLGSQWTTGKISSGGNFNGSDNYVDLGNHLGFDSTQAFSISAWINVPSQSGLLVLIGKNTTDGHTAKGWLIFLDLINGRVYLQLNGDTSFNVSELQTYSTTGIITNNLWNHLVITYSGNQAQSGVNFYSNNVNYSPAGSDSNNLSTSMLNAVNARIGATAGGTDFIQGKIDEVGAWTRELSSLEVSSLYNGGAGLQYPFGTSSTTLVIGTAFQPSLKYGIISY